MSSFEPISTTDSSSGQAQEPLELKYLTIPPAEGKKHSATVIFVHVSTISDYNLTSECTIFILNATLCHGHGLTRITFCSIMIRAWAIQVMDGKISRRRLGRIQSWDMLNGFYHMRALLHSLI
jgi:hypothetical protein